MKLLKITIAFALLVSLQISAAQWLHVPPPVEAKMMMPVVGGGVPTASTSAQIFYSNFNDSTNDAKWGSLPTGWNDDYATSPAPLEGAESLLTDTTAWDAHTGTFTAKSSGPLYARMAFRTKDAPSVNVSANAYIGLQDTGSNVAYCYISYTTADSKFYRVYSGDGITTNNRAFATPTALNDATYFLYLTYTFGASVVCTVTDSAGTPLVDGSISLTTAVSTAVNSVAISNGDGGGTFIFDQVEVRSDTSWGTP